MAQEVQGGPPHPTPPQGQALQRLVQRQNMGIYHATRLLRARTRTRQERTHPPNVHGVLGVAVQGTSFESGLMAMLALCKVPAAHAPTVFSEDGNRDAQELTQSSLDLGRLTSSGCPHVTWLPAI